MDFHWVFDFRDAMPMVGYAAEDVRGINSVMTLLREQLAKIAALMDVVIRRQPKFLGEREQLPE